LRHDSSEITRGFHPEIGCAVPRHLVSAIEFAAITEQIRNAVPALGITAVLWRAGIALGSTPPSAARIGCLTPRTPTC